MHRERVGGRFAAAVLLLAVAGSAAFAQEHKEHKTYRCHDDGCRDLSGGDREVWNVVQPGNIGNDHVLTRPTAPDLSPDRIKATIRIRAWKEAPTVQLLAFDVTGFASGPCEVVR